MKNFIKIFPAIFVLSLLPACGLWTDFTLYFNTYFNASKLFEEAIEQIDSEETNIFDFKQGKIPSTATQNLNKVIEKGSKVLEDGPESAYFDNALYMIGRAYYHLQDYSKALRKFNELTLVKDSDLLLENDFWIAETEMQLRNFDEGFELMEDVRNRALEAEEIDLVKKAYARQIALLIYRESYITAVDLLKKFLDFSDDDELSAKIAYQLGLVYLELDEPQNASDAFTRVSEFSPDPTIEFNSKLESAKLQKELGNIDESKTRLENLRDESKFEDKLDIIDLELGKIEYAEGNLEEALETFTIVDTTYKNSPSAGEARYLIGMIWEDDYLEYDSASQYYSRTLNSQATQEIKTEAQNRSNIINKYLKLRDDLAKSEKRYVYVVNPEVFTKDSLEYEAYLNRDSTKMRDSLGFAYDELLKKEAKNPPQKPFRPNLTADSLQSQISKINFEIGNLFFAELNVLDSAYFYYNKILAEDDSVTFMPKLLFALGTYYSTVGNETKADSIYRVVYDEYRYNQIANEAAKKLGLELIDFESDPARDRYIAAEKVYLDSNYQTALNDFYEIYREYPESRFAPRALYTVGFILENDLSDPDSAASVYDSLTTKFRNTEYARAAMPKLNIYKQEQRRIQDSIAAEKKRIQDSLMAEEAKFLEEEAKRLRPESPADSLNLPGPGIQPDSSALKPNGEPNLNLPLNPADTTGSSRGIR